METELATFIRELVEKNRSFVCAPDTFMGQDVYSVEVYSPIEDAFLSASPSQHFFTMDGNRLEVQER